MTRTNRTTVYVLYDFPRTDGTSSRPRRHALPVVEGLRQYSLPARRVRVLFGPSATARLIVVARGVHTLRAFQRHFGSLFGSLFGSPWSARRRRSRGDGDGGVERCGLPCGSKRGEESSVLFVAERLEKPRRAPRREASPTRTRGVHGPCSRVVCLGTSSALSAPPPPMPGAEPAPAREPHPRADAPANGVGAKMSGASLGADAAPPGRAPGRLEHRAQYSAHGRGAAKSSAPAVQGVFRADHRRRTRGAVSPRLSNADPPPPTPAPPSGPPSPTPPAAPCPYAPPTFRPSPAVLPVGLLGFETPLRRVSSARPGRSSYGLRWHPSRRGNARDRRSSRWRNRDGRAAPPPTLRRTPPPLPTPARKRARRRFFDDERHKTPTLEGSVARRRRARRTNRPIDARATRGFSRHPGEGDGRRPDRVGPRGRRRLRRRRIAATDPDLGTWTLVAPEYQAEARGRAARTISTRWCDGPRRRGATRRLCAWVLRLRQEDVIITVASLALAPRALWPGRHRGSPRTSRSRRDRASPRPSRFFSTYLLSPSTPSRALASLAAAAAAAAARDEPPRTHRRADSPGPDDDVGGAMLSLSFGGAGGLPTRRSPRRAAARAPSPTAAAAGRAQALGAALIAHGGGVDRCSDPPPRQRAPLTLRSSTGTSSWVATLRVVVAPVCVFGSSEMTKYEHDRVSSLEERLRLVDASLHADYVLYARHPIAPRGGRRRPPRPGRWRARGGRAARRRRAGSGRRRRCRG